MGYYYCVHFSDCRVGSPDNWEHILAAGEEWFWRGKQEAYWEGCEPCKLHMWCYVCTYVYTLHIHVRMHNITYLRTCIVSCIRKCERNNLYVRTVKPVVETTCIKIPPVHLIMSSQHKRLPLYRDHFFWPTRCRLIQVSLYIYIYCYVWCTYVCTYVRMYSGTSLIRTPIIRLLWLYEPLKAPL